MIEESKYSTAAVELMRACRRFIHESELRMTKMEKEMEEIKNIDNAILDAKQIKKMTHKEMEEMVSLMIKE